MKAVFIETRNFTEWFSEYISDDEYATLQQILMKNPTQGDVMPGCGGLRKVRTASTKRGKGKRSGARVIYLYIPENRWFFMLDIYGKEEKEDLSTAEKSVLSALAGNLKQQARTTCPKRRSR